MFVKCYTLSDDISEGIKVSAFSSIIADEGTDTITHAQIHEIVLSDDYRGSAPKLSFVIGTDHGTDVSDSAILLSIDTRKWNLYKQGKRRPIMIDPTGKDRHVLVLFHTVDRIRLTGKRDEGKCFIPAQTGPRISRFTPGKLYLAALPQYLGVLPESVSSSLSGGSKASAKDQSRKQPAKHRKADAH